MKRFLISLAALLFLACATPTDNGGIPDYSFGWAYNILVDSAHDWQPDAHLSYLGGSCVDSEGILVDDEMGWQNVWFLNFTNDDNCRTYIIGHDEDPHWHVYDWSLPGPIIAYTNSRIKRVLSPVVQYHDNNYDEYDYRFSLAVEMEYPELSDNPCASIWAYADSPQDSLYRAVVDTVTYKILLIE